MKVSRKHRIFDWLIQVFLVGSLLSSVGFYYWKSASRRDHERRIVELVATAFGIEISEKASVLYDLDNYAIILPTPEATDGDAEFVIRVSTEETIAAIQSLERMPGATVRSEITALPPWHSVNTFFQKQCATDSGSMRLFVRYIEGNGSISKCDLLIVNSEENILGYYSWDQ